MENATTSPLEWIIWTGTALSLIGLAGLIWCIFRVARAKRANLNDDAMRAVLKTAIPINMGALFLSAIGLMMVVLGIFLT
ncbi:MAG: hypothetical protein ACSHXB_15540 [Sulfitobacter sp.]